MINSLFVINNVGYVLISCCQVIILFISTVMLENVRAQSKFIRHLSTVTFSSKNTGKVLSVDQCAIISLKRYPRLVSDIVIMNAPASVIFIVQEVGLSK